MSQQKETGGARSRNRTLDAVKLLTDLSPEALRALGAKCRWLEFAAGDVILERDDDSVDVFFIAKGRVRITAYSDEDRDVALADIGEGGFFGELSAIDNRGRSARVVSSSSSVIAALSRDNFMTTLTEYPGAALRLLDHFASIIRAMNKKVSAFATQAPQQRIYAELLRLARPNNIGDGSWMIESTPHHEEIASWAGTGRETVATTIGILVRDGIMARRNKTLLIKDYAKLRLLAEM